MRSRFDAISGLHQLEQIMGAHPGIFRLPWNHVGLCYDRIGQTGVYSPGK